VGDVEGRGAHPADRVDQQAGDQQGQDDRGQQGGGNDAGVDQRQDPRVAGRLRQVVVDGGQLLVDQGVVADVDVVAADLGVAGARVDDALG
jgi:hypothetical protein